MYLYVLCKTGVEKLGDLVTSCRVCSGPTVAVQLTVNMLASCDPLVNYDVFVPSSLNGVAVCTQGCLKLDVLTQLI